MPTNCKLQKTKEFSFFFPSNITNCKLFLPGNVFFFLNPHKGIVILLYQKFHTFRILNLRRGIKPKPKPDQLNWSFVKIIHLLISEYGSVFLNNSSIHASKKILKQNRNYYNHVYLMCIYIYV